MSNNVSVVGNCVLLLNCALYYARHRRFCLHKRYYIILSNLVDGTGTVPMSARIPTIHGYAMCYDCCRVDNGRRSLVVVLLKMCNAETCDDNLFCLWKTAK